MLYIPSLKGRRMFLLIASILCIIPFIFYTLTEKKHADYISVLKIRAAVANFESGNLTDEDKQNIREIVDFSKENENALISEELKKHSAVTEIYTL